MEPIPVGQVVEYHGTINNYHGLYEVDSHYTLDEVKGMRPSLVTCLCWLVRHGSSHET